MQNYPKRYHSTVFKRLLALKDNGYVKITNTGPRGGKMVALTQKGKDVIQSLS